ncbi:MAG: hypothetical protein LH605_04845, partial [Microbacteriaceae bacterium]|nr:hypothetical protein [Microbacteriaceae bacterium]
ALLTRLAHTTPANLCAARDQFRVSGGGRRHVRISPELCTRRTTNLLGPAGAEAGSISIFVAEVRAGEARANGHRTVDGELQWHLSAKFINEMRLILWLCLMAVLDGCA